VAERLEAAVVVVGGGPAGLAAACHAAEGGSSTLLLDEGERLGGQIWRHRERPPTAARPWLDRLARSGAKVIPGAAVVASRGTGEILVARGAAALHVAFRRLVLATGARELFLPFPGWTLPGVVGAGGAQALSKAGASFEGRRVVVAGSGPLLLAVAAALVREGGRVVAVVEQAGFGRLAAFAASLWRHPRRIGEGLGHAARLVGVPYRTGAWVRTAEGRGRVERVIVTDGRRERVLGCDVVACGFGLVPNLELARLLGCEAEGSSLIVDEAQQTSTPGVYAAGELVGVGGVDQALVTGAIAGLAAAGRAVPPGLRIRRDRERGFAARLGRTFELRAELRSLPRADTIVCRCEDVPWSRIQRAAQAREARLLSRVGMGPCQGRVCGAALSFLCGWEPTAVRPPLSPVNLGVLEDEP
jgi:NADPH-dependent 2,4-dienoyl-CoA reductase/sulfur reductase-like enzyme